MAIIREYKARIEENGLMFLAENGFYRTDSRTIKSTGDAARVLINVFQLNKEAEENLICMVLNASGNIIGAFRATCGSISAVHFDVGGIARKALLLNGVSVIVAHNHPGGVSCPSSEDVEATRQLKAGLDLIGLRLLDHFIIPSCGGYTSMREDGYFDNL